MSKKPIFTRDEIINTAFSIAREEGIERIQARTLADCLCTSTSPIFTLFHSIEEIREAVRQLAWRIFRAYMEALFDEQDAAEFGVRWVRFAYEQPPLYRMLFQQPEGEGEAPYSAFCAGCAALLQGLKEALCRSFSLTPEEGERLLRWFVVYVAGMAAAAAQGELRQSEGFCKIAATGERSGDFVQDAFSGESAVPEKETQAENREGEAAKKEAYKNDDSGEWNESYKMDDSSVTETLPESWKSAPREAWELPEAQEAALYNELRELCAGLAITCRLRRGNPAKKPQEIGA